jgi:hypothetical protein
VPDQKERVFLICWKEAKGEQECMSWCSHVGHWHFSWMMSWLNRASDAWRQYYSFDWIKLVLEVEGFLCIYTPLHQMNRRWKVSCARTIHSILGCNGYGISTHPHKRSGYLLPSQQFNLEDHTTSDIQLLGHFLYISTFRFWVVGNRVLKWWKAVAPRSLVEPGGLVVRIGGVFSCCSILESYVIYTLFLVLQKLTTAIDKHFNGKE